MFGPAADFEDQTFYGCTSLKKISANGITAIKNEVFAECIELSELAGFNSLETIGDLAFYDCLSVDAIVLPDSVSKIEKNALKTV
ncbi:MAG: leucine-rich repeat protein [Anaerostipes hadrus]